MLGDIKCSEKLKTGSDNLKTESGFFRTRKREVKNGIKAKDTRDRNATQ